MNREWQAMLQNPPLPVDFLVLFSLLRDFFTFLCLVISQYRQRLIDLGLQCRRIFNPKTPISFMVTKDVWGEARYK